MSNTRGTEDDISNEQWPEPPLQGVCKDCGNGTLNNALHPAFDVDFDEGLYPVCNQCGSTHVDIL